MKKESNGCPGCGGGNFGAPGAPGGRGGVVIFAVCFVSSLLLSLLLDSFSSVPVLSMISHQLSRLVSSSPISLFLSALLSSFPTSCLPFVYFPLIGDPSKTPRVVADLLRSDRKQRKQGWCGAIRVAEEKRGCEEFER